MLSCLYCVLICRLMGHTPNQCLSSKIKVSSVTAQPAKSLRLNHILKPDFTSPCTHTISSYFHCHSRVLKHTVRWKMNFPDLQTLCEPLQRCLHLGAPLWDRRLNLHTLMNATRTQGSRGVGYNLRRSPSTPISTLYLLIMNKIQWSTVWTLVTASSSGNPSTKHDFSFV